MNYLEYCDNILNESKESRELMRRMNLIYLGYGHYKDKQGNVYKYNSQTKQMEKSDKEVMKNKNFPNSKTSISDMKNFEFNQKAFEEWLKGKKFTNNDTKKQDYFFNLPIKQRQDVKNEYLKSEKERFSKEKSDYVKKIDTIKTQKEKEKSEQVSKSDYDKILKSAIKSLKSNENDIEGLIPDQAESLYYDPQIRNYIEQFYSKNYTFNNKMIKRLAIEKIKDDLASYL